MSIAARKEREKQEMRRMILDAAKKLYIKEGFEKVQIRNIAELIEYSPGTIYLYFKDKDEILLALHTEGFEELYRQQLTTLSIKDPLERLRKHAEVYVRFGLEHPEYYDLMFISRGPARKIEEQQEWTIGMRTYQFLEENIKECIEAGVFAAPHFQAATFAMWSFVHGMVALSIRRKPPMSREELEMLAQNAINLVIDRFKN